MILSKLTFSSASKPVSNLDWQRIAKGIVFVFAFLLLGKIAGAAKEMSIAWRYGIDEVIDAYTLLFSIISWPIALWFNVLSVVLVPLIARMRINTQNKISFFNGELLGFSLLLALFFMLLCYAVLLKTLDAQAVTLAQTTIIIAKQMMITLIWLLPLGLVISLFSVLLLSSGRHRNTLFEAIPPLLLCIAVLHFSGMHKIGTLIWGTILGYLVHLIALTVSLLQTGELSFPKFTLKSLEWKTFGKDIGTITLGQALISLGPIIDQFFVATLSAGSIASLSYTNRVLSLILSLTSVSISRAVLPIFSAQLAESQHSIKSSITNWSLIIFGGSLIAILIAWIFAHPIVTLLFERGAFTAENTDTIANLFQKGLFQVPVYASSLVLVAYFASARKYHLIFISGVLGLLSKIIANYLLIPHFGIDGIMYSYFVVYSINLTFFALMFFTDKYTLYE